MKKALLIPLIIFVILCTGLISKDKITNDKNTVTLSKINDKVWIHTTYAMYENNNTPSNGMVVMTSKGAVLIDTPWTNDETEELIKLVKREFKKNIVLAIITHAHSDRIGGINTLLKYKIPVRSTKLTAQLAQQNGYRKPQATLKDSTVINMGDTRLETYYPGEGHTKDNIVVWLPKYSILFGGCIVKSVAANDLGNTTDASVKQWYDSLKKLINRYPNVKTVIPGHGAWSGKELIEHTLGIFEIGKKVSVNKSDVQWIRGIGGLHMHSRILFADHDDQEIGKIVDVFNSSELLCPASSTDISYLYSKARPIGIRLTKNNGEEMTIWFLYQPHKDYSATSRDMAMLEINIDNHDSYYLIQSKMVMNFLYNDSAKILPNVDLFTMKLASNDGKVKAGEKIILSGDGCISKEVLIYLGPNNNPKKQYLIGKVKTDYGKWSWEGTISNDMKALDGVEFSLAKGYYDITVKTDEYNTGSGFELVD